MNTSATPSYDWNTMQRRLIQFGLAQPSTIQVHRGANTHLDAQQHLSKAAELRNREEDDDGWRTIDPWASTNFVSFTTQFTYRQNLILKDGDKVILHRMGLHSLDKYPAMKRAEAKGRELFHQVREKAPYHQENTSRSGHKHFHFGIWTDQAFKLYITRDTRQETIVGSGKDKETIVDEEAANAAMEFNLWYRDYVDKFVYPLVKSNKYGISPSIKKTFETHKLAYEWLLDQEFAPAARHICHPMFSTFTPFQGFSGNMHPDRSDTEYSFLINFGAKCLLSLGPYQLKVDLQPFDIVFFDTKIPHMTEEKEGDLDKAKRWAISGYVRKYIANQALSESRTAVETVAARAVALKKA